VRRPYIFHNPKKGFHLLDVDPTPTHFRVNDYACAIVCVMTGIDQDVDLPLDPAYLSFDERIRCHAVSGGKLVGYDSRDKPFISFPIRYWLCHGLSFRQILPA